MVTVSTTRSMSQSTNARSTRPGSRRRGTPLDAVELVSPLTANSDESSAWSCPSTLTQNDPSC